MVGAHYIPLLCYCQVYLFNLLAMGADMRTATGDFGFDYGRTAARARQLFTAKHAGKVHVTALFAFCIYVRMIRGTTFVYGEL